MAEMKEIVADLSRSTRELRDSQEKTDAALRKFMGQVGREWGDMVESLTKPSCLGQLQRAGIEVTQVAAETLSRRPGYEQEWDVMLVDGREVVAVEVKSRLRPEDLDRMEEKLRKFKGAFPQYRDYAVYGAVAAIRFDAGAARQAEKRGLFIFEPGGEIMRLVNSEGFRPKRY